MNQESAPAYLDPRHDPDFSAGPAAGWKSQRASAAGGSRSDREPGQPSRFRVRIWVIALVLYFVWTGLFLDPLIGPILLAVLMAFGLTLAVIVGTMALGIMGRGLFAAGDHVIAWLWQGTRWPDQ